MPHLELMSWIATQRRWMKNYRGKRYAVSPRQLGTPATKEASRQGANDWWTKKQAEIDGAAKQHPPVIVLIYKRAIRHHRVYAWWHRRHGNVEEAAKSEEAIEWLQQALQSDDPPFPLSAWQQDPAWEEKKGGGIVLLSIWNAREFEYDHEQQAEISAPTANTIKAHIDQYLDLYKARAQANGKLGAWATTTHWLRDFRAWVDPFAPVETLNEGLWERYFVYLSDRVTDGTFAKRTAKNYQAAVRAFIKSRWENRLIDLPRNLDTDRLSFRITPTEPVPFTVDEIKQILSTATGRARLYILLALNCAAYPSDISALRHDEVDWVEGYVTRKRTKTKDAGENVPKVGYLLWRQTFELLKEYRSDHPELVLVNANGTPLWVEREKNGKFCRIDAVKNTWFRLMTKLKGQGVIVKKPLKALRKTCPSLLQHHQTYGQYAQYFLGHSPRSVADRSYVARPGRQLDDAIRWLGEQLGIE